MWTRTRAHFALGLSAPPQLGKDFYPARLFADAIGGGMSSRLFQQLREEGCTEVQGYHFSPPRPASEIRKLIASMKPKLKVVA